MSDRAEQASSVEHVATATTHAVSDYKYSSRLDTISMMRFTVEQPHFFNRGDVVEVSFPESSAGGSYPVEFSGIVHSRDISKSTIIAYDWGIILKNVIVNFDRNKYVGWDPLHAIHDIISEADELNLITTGNEHGTSPKQFITYEDNIHSEKDSAWKAILKILSICRDASNTGYTIPYHIWFEQGTYYIEKRADIEDSSTYPATYTLEASDVPGIQYYEHDDEVASRVTCIGQDGKQITVTDTNMSSDFLGTSGYSQIQEKVINYDSSNLDDLQKQALDYLLLKRSIQGEYKVSLPNLFGVRLNQIIDINGEQYGLNGRFVVAGITIDSNLKVSVTLSGQQTSLVDVL